MGDTAWIGIVVTISLAIIGGFYKLITKINDAEFRLRARIDEVETNQTNYRHASNENINHNLNQLEEKIDGAMKESDRAHRELLVQVKDMALTMHDNFVSKPDLKDALSLIREAITDARKEIGAVHARLDDFYKGRN